MQIMSAVSFWSPVEVHNDKMPLITGDREQIKDKRWHKQKVKRLIILLILLNIIKHNASEMKFTSGLFVLPAPLIATLSAESMFLLWSTDHFPLSEIFGADMKKRDAYMLKTQIET